VDFSKQFFVQLRKEFNENAMDGEILQGQLII